MWADAAKNRRCLVLSTGIVESRHVPKIGKKGQELKETIKYPYYITLKNQEYFFMPGLYNEWLDPETSQFVNTVAIGITQANALMGQIHNSKFRMPTILTEDLAYEWLLEKPDKDRLSTIARTQIPSRLMEFCTIDPNYRTANEATPREFPELAALNSTYLDVAEELVFNAWPDDLEPVTGEIKPELVDTENAAKSYYPPGMAKQGDLFN
jgi:putative SOS response-associated peptidase YedK